MGPLLLDDHATATTAATSATAATAAAVLPPPVLPDEPDVEDPEEVEGTDDELELVEALEEFDAAGLRGGFQSGIPPAPANPVTATEVAGAGALANGDRSSLPPPPLARLPIPNASPNAKTAAPSEANMSFLGFSSRAVTVADLQAAAPAAEIAHSTFDGRLSFSSYSQRGSRPGRAS